MAGYYAVMVAGSGDQDLCVFHHDDPEAGSAGWINVGQMTYGFSIKTLWAEQDGDLIHIVVQCDDGNAYYNVYNPDVLATQDSFAAPGTEGRGLAWDGTNLWHSDLASGLIYKLDPSDGSEIDSFASPGGSPFGLAWDGTNLWHCDYGADLVYKLDPSDGTVLDSFASPAGFPTGLAWDGLSLWLCDAGSDLIYKLDPSDGTVLNSFASPSTNAQGLAWDGTYLWQSDDISDLIYKLDPSDGTVLSSSTAASASTKGIAWDGTYLWSCDPNTDLIYKTVGSFTTSKELIATATHITHVIWGCGVTKRSNGEIVAVYADTWLSNVSTTALKRRVAGVWQTAVSFGNGLCRSIVADASSRVVTHNQQDNSSTGQSRILKADNTVGSAGPTTYATGIGTKLGTNQYFVPILDNGGVDLAMVHGQIEDDFTNKVVDTISASVTPYKPSNMMVAAAAADGTDIHVLYADNVTQSLWHDKDTGSGFGTDVELIVGEGEFVAGPTSGSPTAIQVYGEGGTNERIAQSFSVAQQSVATQIRINHWLTGGTGGTGNVLELRDALEGNILATASLPSNQSGQILVDLPGSVILQASTTYYVVIRKTTARDTVHYAGYARVTDAIAGQSFVRNSGTWTPNDADLDFGVYHRPVRRVNAMVYDHDGTKLAYLYDDAGVVKYGEVSLGSVPTDLVIQNASHGHTVENVMLTQVHALVLQDAAHIHSADNQVLTQLHILASQDTLHDVTSDNVVLEQIYNLIVDDSLHSHIADNIDLDQSIMQRAYALSTIATNGWFAVGAASVHEALNETSPNDSTYVEF